MAKSQFLALLEEQKPKLDQLLASDKYLSGARMLALADQIQRSAYGSLRKAIDDFPASVVNCIVQAADLGLEPNTALHHCALVPFKTKGGGYACQLIIQYQGYVHLVISNGAATDVRGDLIFAKEIEEGRFYEQPTSLREPIVHKPDPRFKRPLVRNSSDAAKAGVAGAYALAFLPGGAVKARWMDIEEIEYIRKTYSRAAEAESGKSPWETRYSEMAKKTPLRNLIKTMRLTGEAKVQRAFELDESEWQRRTDIEIEPEVTDMPTPAKEAALVLVPGGVPAVPEPEPAPKPKAVEPEKPKRDESPVTEQDVKDLLAMSKQMKVKTSKLIAICEEKCQVDDPAKLQKWQILEVISALEEVAAA